MFSPRRIILASEMIDVTSVFATEDLYREDSFLRDEGTRKIRVAERARLSNYSDNSARDWLRGRKSRGSPVLAAEKTGIMDHQRGSVRQSLCYVILYTCFSAPSRPTGNASFSPDSSNRVSARHTSYELADSFLFLIRGPSCKRNQTTHTSGSERSIAGGTTVAWA